MYQYFGLAGEHGFHKKKHFCRSEKMDAIDRFKPVGELSCLTFALKTRVLVLFGMHYVAIRRCCD